MAPFLSPFGALCYTVDYYAQRLNVSWVPGATTELLRLRIVAPRLFCCNAEEWDIEPVAFEERMPKGLRKRLWLFFSCGIDAPDVACFTQCDRLAVAVLSVAK